MHARISKGIYNSKQRGGAEVDIVADDVEVYNAVKAELIAAAKTHTEEPSQVVANGEEDNGDTWCIRLVLQNGTGLSSSGSEPA